MSNSIHKILKYFYENQKTRKSRKKGRQKPDKNQWKMALVIWRTSNHSGSGHPTQEMIMGITLPNYNQAPKQL